MWEGVVVRGVVIGVVIGVVRTLSVLAGEEKGQVGME